LPTGHCIWDLWWIIWQCGKFIPEYSGFPTDRVCPQDTVYGICGGPCGSVASLSPSTVVCPTNYYSTNASMLINFFFLFYDA